MYWYRKTFPRFGAEWGSDQNRLAELLLSVAGNGTDEYRRMMMVTVENQDSEDVYLCLTAKEHALFFPGYDASSQPARVTSFLVGDQTEFDRVFR